MKSIVLYFGGSEKTLFDRNVRDNCNEPFIYLKEKLSSIGYSLILSSESTDEDLRTCEWILFVNSPLSAAPDLYQKCINNGRSDRMALFLWEGDSIMQENYLPSVHDKFKLIFTWKTSYVDGKKFFRFYLPITATLPTIPKFSFHQKKLLVNISRNIFSAYKNELYSARRKSIRYFSKHSPDDFDLFGYGWNQPTTRWQRLFPFLVEKISTYRGSISNKHEVLPRYKFSLCYENLKDEPDYITEKIFDCFKSGTVPIYWGASNIEDYVPLQAFIDRRQYKTDKELLLRIATIGEKEYNEYLNAAEKYLQSEAYARFLPEYFSHTILSTLTIK